MIKCSIVVLGFAIALAGCSTTQRQEVRNDERNIQKQHRQVDAAMRNGTANEVREEQADVREAQRELREDRSKLYTPDAQAAPLQIGERDNGRLYTLREYDRSRYADGASSYYLTDGRMIYQLGKADRTVIAVYPITPGG